VGEERQWGLDQVMFLSLMPRGRQVVSRRVQGLGEGNERNCVCMQRAVPALRALTRSLGAVLGVGTRHRGQRSAGGERRGENAPHRGRRHLQGCAGHRRRGAGMGRWEERARRPQEKVAPVGRSLSRRSL